jgi:hypothetical protein
LVRGSAVLRRSPTTFGVLLSFSTFAGLLTLLLLAQTRIPEPTPLSQEPLPTDVVGPALVAPSDEPPAETGPEAPGSSVLTVPDGPVIVVAPVGGTTGLVQQPTSPQEKAPGEQPGGGNQPNPPADQPSPPGGQPSPPGGQLQPSPPAAGDETDADEAGDADDAEEKPSGQPTAPPGVLPSSAEPDDDADDDEDDDDTSDTDAEDRGDDDDGGEGKGKESNGGGKSKN